MDYVPWQDDVPGTPGTRKFLAMLVSEHLLGTTSFWLCWFPGTPGTRKCSGNAGCMGDVCPDAGFPMNIR